MTTETDLTCRVIIGPIFGTVRHWWSWDGARSSNDITITVCGVRTVGEPSQARIPL